MRRNIRGALYNVGLASLLIFLNGTLSQALADANLNDTINADQVHEGGILELDLAGRGVVVGVWDSGPVRASHEVFDDPVPPPPPQRIVAASDVTFDFPAFGIDPDEDDNAAVVPETSRVTVQQGSGFSDHGTHVAGIIGGKSASNPSARGVADRVQILSWTAANDTFEMANNAHLLDLSNHSYGLDLDSGSGAFGDYRSHARAVDQIAYDNPHYLSVWSAGNSGGFGFDTLTGLGKTAKNTLVVGAVSDHTVDPHNGNSVSLASFSSRGPIDDGRLAPHVVANGVAVTSAIGTGDASYASFSGTSMAAPAATGAAALLIEHTVDLRGSKPLAATTKALLMHTATDITTGSLDVGPDYESGYGLVNVAEGATFLSDALAPTSPTQEDFLFELDLSTGEETVFDFRVVANEVKATLVWTDLPGTPVSGTNNRTPMLINDLDLWGESGGTTFYPWTLDVLNPGAAATRDKRNTLDNVEQVFIDNLAPLSNLSLHVGHTGALATGLQDYSLLISGVQLVPEPSGLVLLASGLGLVFGRRGRRMN